MSDVLIVYQFEISMINVFGMQIGFIILSVSTIVEVPLSRSQIGPCLKCVQVKGVQGGKPFMFKRK